MDEAGSVGLADEERGDSEVDLVGEVLGEELGVDLAAALNHEPADAPGGEVVQHRAGVDGGARADHGREAGQDLAAAQPPAPRGNGAGPSRGNTSTFP